MIYDNCEKYIKEVAMEEIATCDLRNKKIIVNGLMYYQKLLSISFCGKEFKTLKYLMTEE